MRFPLQLAADQLLMRLEGMGEVFLGTHAEVGIVRGGKQRFAEFGCLRVLDLQRPRTGTGYSVLDVIHAYEDANGVKIPYEIVDRRPGDVAENYADPSLAKELLGWVAKRDLYNMCKTGYHWQSMNPNGYDA